VKLAVFSDIHGNLPFFEAFLRDAEREKVDRLVFLGDAVSYYPDGCAVLRRLRELGALCIEGNHDSMLRGEFPVPEKHEPVYQLRSVMTAIDPEELAFVKTWPEIVHETLDGKHLTFVHGNPLNHLKGYSYADSELALYDDPDEDIVFVGHTHRPWIRQNFHTLMVNVGSVGLPRDEGGGSRPAWALYDSSTGIPEIRRVHADIAPLLAMRGKVHESVLEALNR
jgi:putative phosphoesterase